MKKIFVLTLLFSSLFLSAQSGTELTKNDKKIFLDSLWKKTTEGNHKYLMIIKKNDPDNTFEVTNYYRSTGKIQMKGSYKDENLTKQTGNFFWYYDNGNIKCESISKDSLNETGEIYSYYLDGNKESIEKFDYKRLPKKSSSTILQFWDKKGNQLVINGNGIFDLDNEEMKRICKIKNGNIVGERITHYKLSNYKNIDYYDEEGYFIKGVTIDPNGKKTKYTEFETQPKPKQGIEHFYKYISKNFTSTNEAIKHKVKGKISLEFIVEKDGKITEIKVIQGLGFGLDEEAVRVLANYKNWIPGQQNGRPIRAKYIIPISISLK